MKRTETSLTREAKMAFAAYTGVGRRIVNELIVEVEMLNSLIRDIDRVVVFDGLPDGNELQDRIEAVFGIKP